MPTPTSVQTTHLPCEGRHPSLSEFTSLFADEAKFEQNPGSLPNAQTGFRHQPTHKSLYPQLGKKSISINQKPYSLSQRGRAPQRSQRTHRVKKVWVTRFTLPADCGIPQLRQVHLDAAVTEERAGRNRGVAKNRRWFGKRRRKTSLKRGPDAHRRSFRLEWIFSSPSARRRKPRFCLRSRAASLYPTARLAMTMATLTLPFAFFRYVAASSLRIPERLATILKALSRSLWLFGVRSTIRFP